MTQTIWPQLGAPDCLLSMRIGRLIEHLGSRSSTFNSEGWNRTNNIPDKKIISGIDMKCQRGERLAINIREHDYWPLEALFL